MAAGLGFKDFVTGEVLTAGDTNGYLMQGVLVFASAAARTSAITSPQEGQMSFLKDTNSTEYYSGSAWVAVAGASGINSGVATVATSESTTSTTYTDLTTSGPEVTITTGTKVLVIVTSQLNGDASGTRNYMDFAISGATTRAASDTTALIQRRAAGDHWMRTSAASSITVTAGSNVFTSKYKTSAGGTATFENREIFVMDLGS